MSKGYCEGNKQLCNITDCPLFGSLRVFPDDVKRVKQCGDKPKTTLKRTRLKPFSNKTISEFDERKVVREKVLARDTYTCQAKWVVKWIECSGPLDVDEIIPRGRGGDYLDIDNCQTLCRLHHRWKHDNPAEAERLGFTKSLPPK